MNSSAQYLNPSEAARRLGVSVKALRLYEERGLVAPVRSAAGWRAYGPDEMARAAKIVALRALGLSLAQVAEVLNDDPQALAAALVIHQARLETALQAMAQTIDGVRTLRADIATGRLPDTRELANILVPANAPGVSVELPWPWGGERFELPALRALTYIIGPLGSGKTRLARLLAESLPGATFLGLEREPGEPNQAVRQTMTWLAEDGATPSPALTGLLIGLCTDGDGPVIVDMVEQGLDHASQEALIAHLRHRGPMARPLVLMTRSSAILDLGAVGADETIIFCPANHSPPSLVRPYPGVPGYEAVASCLATPEVRARSEGVIAFRPQVA